MSHLQRKIDSGDVAEDVSSAKLFSCCPLASGTMAEQAVTHLRHSDLLSTPAWLFLPKPHHTVLLTDLIRHGDCFRQSFPLCRFIIW
jgi:hypothetical protein